MYFRRVNELEETIRDLEEDEPMETQENEDKTAEPDVHPDPIEVVAQVHTTETGGPVTPQLPDEQTAQQNQGNNISCIQKSVIFLS